MMTCSKYSVVALLLILSYSLCSVQCSQQIRTRINFFKAAAVAVSATLIDFSQCAIADIGPNDIMCTLTVKKGATLPKGSDPAIYLTARQDVGIWTAQIKNMKPPPILTSRAAGPFAFPTEILLSAKNDITPEGVEIINQWQSGKKPIVVSARLDADGVAATRNAEDLVGKAIASKDSSGAWKGCEIQLTDRGVGGKLVTKKR